jgi:hypothetical protein
VTWPAILAALIVALLVAGSGPFWVPLLPWSPAGNTALEAGAQTAESARRATDARIARLEAQVQQIETAVHNAAPASALGGLTDRVSALEHRPDTAAQTAQALAAMQQTVAGLSARLDAVESKLGKVAAAQSQEIGSDRMLFLALASLRAAMAASGPFQGELDSVETLARGDTALEGALQPLEGAAASGIPSTALLAERFDQQTAPAIFRAAATAETPGEGWGERILARIRALVVVRRVDGGGDPTDVAVARARRALDAGDLAGGVAAVKTLSGPAAGAAAAWLGQAEQRLAAQAALDRAAQLVARRQHGDSN